MSFIETWDSTKPAGSRDRSLGDDDIREFKRAIIERLAVDHIFVNDETGYTTIGYHLKCTLVKQASNPSAVASAGIFYTKDAGSGAIEAYYMDAAGNVIQLTTAGKLRLNSGRLPNDTYLTGRNAADSADINIIKVNSSNTLTLGAVTTLPDTSTLATSGAPAADAQIANKKYVDDQNTSQNTTLNAAIAAAQISEIKDYGSSASSSTTRASSAIKIAFGSASLSSGSLTISNLSFASSSSYTVIVSLGTSPSTQSQGITVERNSGSGFTVTDSQGTNKVVQWMAIGT